MKDRIAFISFWLAIVLGIVLASAAQSIVVLIPLLAFGAVAALSYMATLMTE